MKNTKLNWVPCSDWMRGWGYGGNNHIGKLRKGDLEGTYIWQGNQHGRHGQIWNHKAEITFKVMSDEPFEIEVLQNLRKRSLPDYRDVQEAIRILNT